MQPTSPAFRWGACFASMALPGAGHAMAGHANRATTWLGVMLVTMLLSAVGAWWWLGALAVGMVVLCVLYVGCCIDAYAASAARRQSSVVAWIGLTAVGGVTFFVAPAALALIIRVGALEAYKTPSGAMCPTVAIGDHFFVDKTAYRSATPARGDVVVYRKLSGASHADFVHRVVGVAGDDIEIRDGMLILNGKRLPTVATSKTACSGLPVSEEELGTRHTIVHDSDAPREHFRTRVATGTVFVMGDNRDNAHDSRYTGAIPVADVRGRIWRRWLCGPSLCWERVP